MNNTIILKKGYGILTKNELKSFEKGLTIWGDSAYPEEIKRWSIENKEDALKELAEYVCKYSGSREDGIVLTEYALEYCECDEEGEFIVGSDFDFAPVYISEGSDINYIANIVFCRVGRHKTYCYEGHEVAVITDEAVEKYNLEVLETAAENNCIVLADALRGLPLEEADWGGPFNYIYDPDDKEIVITDIMNPYNEQKLICAVIVQADYAKDDYIDRMYCTYTNRYYDWTSRLTMLVKDIESATDKDDLSRIKQEWESETENLKFTGGDKEIPTFEEVIEDNNLEEFIDDMEDIDPPSL